MCVYPCEPFSKNCYVALLSFDYHDAVTQHIHTCTQQLLICRYNHVCLRGVCADGNFPVMTFPWVFACAWTLGGVASFAYSTCICA